MKRQWLVIAALLLALVLIGLVVRAKFFSKPGPGALQVSTTPKTAVYLDGNQLGITPFFDDKITPGEHTVRLVPQTGEGDSISWEGKVNVTPNILTVINRELTASEASSSGEILTLEKTSKKNTSSLAVVSTPDQAVVKVNGEPKGFTPIQLEDLTPGDYQVTVSLTGYRERTISANTISSYKLTVNIKLAQEVSGISGSKVEGEKKENEEGSEKKEESTSSPTPSPKTSPQPTTPPPDKPYIKVKETPTGWLRVRAEPSSVATETAKIYPGETYSYLNEEKNGWYKIEYEKEKEGWVSGAYVDLFK